MLIRTVTVCDIPAWRALSSEYDRYVSELVGDIGEWYEGGNGSPAFIDYMNAKISKQEAFMAVSDGDRCLGIIAVSRQNNRITFFGISRGIDISAARSLLLYALTELDASRDIFINLLDSPSAWIDQHRAILTGLGFEYVENSLENNVPVKVFRYHHITV